MVTQSRIAFLFVCQLSAGFYHRIIHTVMDIEGGKVPVADTAPAHVRFIRQDECRSYLVHWISRAFIMVADSADNSGKLVCVRPQII